MYLRKVILGLSACLLLCSVVTVDVYGGNDDDDDKKPKVRTVKVDCFKGKSINKALKKHKKNEVIIEIDGICTENVIVERGNVTLRGSDPATDGIRATSSDDIVLTIRDVRGVTVENLKVTGGLDGIRLADSINVTVNNCLIEDNRRVGLLARATRNLNVIDTTSTGSDRAISVRLGTQLACRNCTLLCTDPDCGENNRIVGLVIQSRSTARVFDSTIIVISNQNLAEGVRMGSYATLDIDNSTLTASRNALRLGNYSRASMTGGTLNGSILLNQKSRAVLFGIEQTTLGSFENGGGAAPNFITDGSQLRTVTCADIGGIGGCNDDSPPPNFNIWKSTVLQNFSTARFNETDLEDISLNTFSNARFDDSTLDNLTCSAGSDAFCSAVTKTSSTCALCP